MAIHDVQVLCTHVTALRNVLDKMLVSCRMEICGRKLETRARLESALLLVFRDFCDKSLKAALRKAALIGFATS